MGVKTIYRQSNDETLSMSPDAFVNERAKNAPTATFIHTTNELDPTPDLLAWTMEAMKYADSIKRKLVILNYSTHRTAAQWNASVDVVRRGVSNGHAIGLHIYTEQAGDSGAHQYHALKQQVGGTWIITEFGFAKDAHHGWRGTLSQEQYAAYCQMYLPSFAAERMPVLLFSYDHWTANEEGKAHGFGVNDAPTFLSALAALNAKYPLKEGIPVPPTPPTYPPGEYRLADIPADYVNLRATPSTSGADLGDLHVGDKVILSGIASDGWLLLTTQDGKRGWVSSQGGAVTFEPVSAPVPTPTPTHLGIDISQAQASVDWVKVKAAGYSFALIRATQGTASSRPVGADTRFRQHIEGALAAGMDVGVYHNYLPDADGNKQAEFYFTAIAPYLDRLAFPPAVDVETVNGYSQKVITERLYALVQTLAALIGQMPMIYTNWGFWNAHTTPAHDAYFANCPLWIAAWTTATTLRMPRAWEGKTWAVWQFSNSGRVLGVSSERTDLNRRKA